MIPSPTEQLAEELAEGIASALTSLRPTIDEHIKILALDFHPWDGSLGLAVLTKEESDSVPKLNDVSRMAEWKHFGTKMDFAKWDINSVLGRMKAIYYEAIEEGQDLTDSLFRCCAVAMSSPSVQQAIDTYKLADGFQISVSHPDDNYEHYPPLKDA